MGRTRRWCLEGWQGVLGLRRALTPRRALTLAVLAVVVLVAGVLGYRAWQASYYEGLYVRDHTIPGGLQQLYREGMAGTDQAWLVSKDGGRTYKRTAFVAYTPVLEGGTSGEPMVGLAPYTYRDAEVDLWMFQFGAGATAETGLVLRADSATGDMVVFGLNQASGMWSVREHTHGGWAYLQTPTFSDRIERRANTNNLLTALVRGDEYAFLINYHFVGVYHDDAPPRGVRASSRATERSPASASTSKCSAWLSGEGREPGLLAL